MTTAKTVTLNVNSLYIDGDNTPEHVTFRVTQTGEQSFSVQTFIDLSSDGFGKLNSNTTKLFDIDTPPNWQLSSLKFENQKMILLGRNGTQEALSVKQVIPGIKETLYENVFSFRSQPILGNVLSDEKRFDNGIAENAGVVGAIRGYESLDTHELKAPDTSLFDAVINRNMGQIRAVYNEELEKNPLPSGKILTGKISIRYIVSSNGTVTSATVKFNDMNFPEAGERVADAICARFMKFQFPAPASGGDMIATHEFSF